MKNNEIVEILDALYQQAKLQLGAVVKGRWFYDGDGCPACGKEISAVKYKKQEALSINTFIFRDYGVLIAYLLCGKCAGHIIRESKKSPIGKLPIHDKIEASLKHAFVKHLGH